MAIGCCAIITFWLYKSIIEEMGNQVSMDAFEPSHVRIYRNILQIQNPQKRAQMIQTCLAGMEYVTSAKRAGIYSYLLGYVSAVLSGSSPQPLPGENGPAPGTSYIRATPIRNEIIQPPRALAGPPPQLQMQITTYKEKKEGPAWMQLTNTKQQKAISYFASCLEVLEIQDEVALTEDILKKAYKRLSKVAHPDKGGSEEHFEAITRAYAYLSEILKRMQGGREKEGVVEAPKIIDTTRREEAKSWQHIEPVKLNPKNLDMNAFNKMFEQTHMPDPDNDGYGDWLKSQQTDKSAPKFGGKFNRDVFNSMFDEEARKSSGPQKNNALVVHPDAMALLPTMGVEIGRDRPETYTAAPNSKQQYTDLRAAYTSDNTFSGNVANVRVENRNYESYRASREAAPPPLSSEEMNMLQQSEKEIAMREQMRQRRKAERDVAENDYFARMKQYVITNNQ
jgi:curved DNA-binding protein CbpA